MLSHKPKFYVMVGKLKAIASREWDGENQVNTFAKSDEPEVRGVLSEFYAGHTLVTPEGTEVIEAA